jgi:hypothetical protein
MRRALLCAVLCLVASYAVADAPRMTKLTVVVPGDGEIDQRAWAIAQEYGGAAEAAWTDGSRKVTFEVPAAAAQKLRGGRRIRPMNITTQAAPASPCNLTVGDDLLASLNKQQQEPVPFLACECQKQRHVWRPQRSRTPRFDDDCILKPARIFKGRRHGDRRCHLFLQCLLLFQRRSCDAEARRKSVEARCDRRIVVGIA